MVNEHASEILKIETELNQSQANRATEQTQHQEALYELEELSKAQENLISTSEATAAELAAVTLELEGFKSDAQISQGFQGQLTEANAKCEALANRNSELEHQLKSAESALGLQRSINVAATTAHDGASEAEGGTTEVSLDAAASERCSALEGQLEAERRHTSTLKTQLAELELRLENAASENSLDLVSVFDLDHESDELASGSFAPSSCGERLAQCATRVSSWARNFFLQQSWGAAQIAFLYVIMLHYYAIFYKRSAY